MFTKKLFQRKIILVSSETLTVLGDGLRWKLKEKNIDVSTRQIPKGYCLFSGTDGSGQYVTDTLLVVPLKTEKFGKLVEGSNAMQMIEKVRGIGFSKVFVMGTTKALRSACDEQKFNFIKVDSRKKAVDELATVVVSAAYAGEGESVAAAPLESIQLRYKKT